MNGAGNDFVIIDCRKENFEFSPSQIAKISDRQNIGCDQFILIKNSSKADCFMDIYNSDGSKSGACGNATRCVAGLLFEENPAKDQLNIETSSEILKCSKNAELISVNMGIPSFAAQDIPLSQNIDSQKLSLFGFDFACVNVGNPHAVTFIKEPIADDLFFEIGAKIENHQLFPEKTNVEFAQIFSDDLIKVRVFERGAGETLACGSGACAVGILAIKHNLISSNKTAIEFKGGIIEIEYNGENSAVIMSGNYQKDFEGFIDEELLS